MRRDSLCLYDLYQQGAVMMIGRDLSDEQLARGAQAGDREAFFTLYERYLQRVTNRVRSKVPTQDVEDVTQDIFVAVVRSLNRYEQRARFNTWLYTIVNRQIADFYRRRQRKDSPETVELSGEGNTALAWPVDEALQDDQAHMRQALERLPAHYSDIILMRFADGLSFSEIAERRDQSLDAVKSLYRRALQALREAMGEA